MRVNKKLCKILFALLQKQHHLLQNVTTATR